MDRKTMESLPRQEIERQAVLLLGAGDVSEVPTAVLVTMILVALGEAAGEDVTTAALLTRIRRCEEVIESNRERHGRILLRMDKDVIAVRALLEAVLHQRALDAVLTHYPSTGTDKLAGMPPTPSALAQMSTQVLRSIVDTITAKRLPPALSDDSSMTPDCWPNNGTGLASTRSRAFPRAALLNIIADAMGWTPWREEEEDTTRHDDDHGIDSDGT